MLKSDKSVTLSLKVKIMLVVIKLVYLGLDHQTKVNSTNTEGGL